MAEDPSSSSERDESDSEPIVFALKISRAGNEECCGKYTESGTKDGVGKYVKEWSNPDEADKRYLVEIFRQFSNENHKRYWWMMGRTLDKEKNHRLGTTLLYCVKSESNTPPTTGWKVLKDGSKPTPKVKLMKATKDPSKGKKEVVERKKERKTSVTSVSSDASEENPQGGMMYNQYQPMAQQMGDMRHLPYLPNAHAGGIRRFALDRLVSSAHPLDPSKAQTHRSEPVGGMERIEHNLVMEGSDNLISLLGENGDHVMMILNNIRDLKARHSKSMKYLKTIKKDNPNRKQFAKSMEEEKRMITALIEMNTTLSRNCAYLGQVAQALQIHLKDVYRSKTHDGVATAYDRNANFTNNAVHSVPTNGMQSAPQSHAPSNPIAMQHNQIQHQHQQPNQIQHQHQQPQIMHAPAPPQMQHIQPSVTQVSHRTQPTLVSIQRPPQQLIQAPIQHPSYQVVSAQQQQHLRARTMTAMHQPQRTMTYVQQVQPRPQMVRPATIQAAQHRTQLTSGVPHAAMMQQQIPQNIVYQRQPQVTRVSY